MKTWLNPEENEEMLKAVEIAMVCHEVNRAYCQALGDESQLSWNDCPMWQRESAVAGVTAHLANPEMTPEDSHKEWSAHKVKDGWKFGPVKNPDAKEHPCLVEYSKLPVEQRAKDYIFRAIVHSLK
jgi:hypothetical protein